MGLLCILAVRAVIQKIQRRMLILQVPEQLRPKYYNFNSSRYSFGSKSDA